MATQIEIQNNIHLERLLISHPEMEKKVRNIVRKIIIGAQGGVQNAAKPMSTKDAYKAVRKAVYKKVLGGNINIISSSRRAGQRAPLPAESPRKKSSAVGGNRMPRSRRTEDLLTYAGADRGFILRFLNNGTADRHNGTRRTGAIQARNWFEPSASRELNNAAEQFDLLLDALIKKEFS